MCASKLLGYWKLWDLITGRDFIIRKKFNKKINTKKMITAWNLV